MTEQMTLEKVHPQPSYIESSGRWEWPLPERAQFPGCCKSVVTASREWWEYTPSEARPHPMAEAVQLRDEKWHWVIPHTIDACLDAGKGEALETVRMTLEAALIAHPRVVPHLIGDAIEKLSAAMAAREGGK